MHPAALATTLDVQNCLNFKALRNLVNTTSTYFFTASRPMAGVNELPSRRSKILKFQYLP